MSERPVPRRESPWGMPEGDHRQPKPHRCNDRAEDVIQPRTKNPKGGRIWETLICKRSGRRHALKVIPLKQFQGLSSYSGSACVANLDELDLHSSLFKLKSSDKEEPTEPFYYLELEPPQREVKLE